LGDVWDFGGVEENRVKKQVETAFFQEKRLVGGATSLGLYE
jgi:hypothetical protein